MIGDTFRIVSSFGTLRARVVEPYSTADALAKHQAERFKPIVIADREREAFLDRKRPKRWQRK